jgi:hypothetical protein
MELSRRHQNEALENPMKKFGNAAISRHFQKYVSNMKSGAPCASLAGSAVVFPPVGSVEVIRQGKAAIEVV